MPSEPQVEDMLFSELVKEYMDFSEIRRKQSTCGTKEHIIIHKILPYFKDKKVFSITVKDIETWQNTLLTAKTNKGTKLSDTYIRTIRSQLTAIMNYAVRMYGLPFNPLYRAEMIGKKDAEDRPFWTLEQYKLFREVAAEKPSYYYAFEVLYWTGMRMGELLALKYNDLDLVNLTITIDETYNRIRGKDVITSPKTASSKRIVHIPEVLAYELSEYITGIYGLDNDTRLFQVTKSGLHRELDRVIEICGLPDMPVHGFRHSFASLLQSEEVKAPEIVVSTFLGHSKQKTMTAKYSHVYQKDLVSVADRLNEIMEEMENV